MFVCLAVTVFSFSFVVVAYGSFYVAPRLYMINQKLKIAESQWETYKGHHDYIDAEQYYRELYEPEFYYTWDLATNPALMNELYVQFIAAILSDLAYCGRYIGEGGRYCTDTEAMDLAYSLLKGPGNGKYNLDELIVDDSTWRSIIMLVNNCDHINQVQVPCAIGFSHAAITAALNSDDPDCSQQQCGDHQFSHFYDFFFWEAVRYPLPGYGDTYLPRMRYKKYIMGHEDGNKEEQFEDFFENSVKDNINPNLSKEYDYGIVHTAGLMLPISMSSGHKTHFGSSVALGVDLYDIFNIPIRFELEVQMPYKGFEFDFPRHSDLLVIPQDTFNTAKDISMAFRSATKIDYKITLSFVNIFFDFHNKTKFTPFIGGGFGASFISVDIIRSFSYSLEGDQDVLNGGESIPLLISNKVGRHQEKSKSHFAWHFALGVSYSYNESIKLELMYRYIDVGYKKTINLFSQYIAARGGEDVSEDYIGYGKIKFYASEVDMRKAQQILVGLRFHF
jgi:opacity protein-like surface antigen